MQLLHLRLHSASVKAHNESAAAPALEDRGSRSAFDRSSSPPAALPPALALIFIYVFIYFFIQLRGFEGRSGASLLQPSRLPTAGLLRQSGRSPGVAALGASKTFWEGWPALPEEAFLQLTVKLLPET